MDIIEDLRLNHEFCPKEVILAAADEIERLRGVLIEIQAEVEHSLPSGDDPTVAEGLSHTIYLMTMRGLMPNV